MHHENASWCLGRSEESDRFPEIELLMVASFHVGTWSQTRVLRKSNKCSKRLSYVFSPQTSDLNLRPAHSDLQDEYKDYLKPRALASV